MNQSTLSNLAGWSAVINGATSIISTVTIAIYFAIGGPWGTINDSNSVFWILSFIPIAILFYRMHQAISGPLNMLATGVGFAGMITFAISQSLLAIGLVQFEQTFTLVLTMTGLVGSWLFLQGLLARRNQILPAKLIWLMIAYGISFILGMIGFLIGSWENPLALVGFLFQAIIGPIWAFYLGKVLLSGHGQPAAVSS